MLNTHQLSISQAAKVAKVARSTLYNNYINNGRISVSETTDGEKYIDASEIARVFNKISPQEPKPKTDGRDKLIAELEASNERLKFSLMVANDEVSKQARREDFLQKTVISLSHRLTHEDSIDTGSNTTNDTGDVAKDTPRSGVLSRFIRWLV